MSFAGILTVAAGYRSGKQGHQYRPPATAYFRYAAGHRIHQDECGDKEAAHDGGRGAVLPGGHRGQGRTGVRESGGRLCWIPFHGQERLPRSSHALGTPLQPHGQAVQRYLPGADAEHHATCLPPYLLQQHGKIGHEPQDAPIPDGA